MISVLISLMVQLVVITVQLTIMLVRLMVVGTVWLVRAIASALESRSSRPGAARLLPRGRIPQDLRWMVFERDGYACAHCGSRYDLTIDHIHPVSLGGTNDPSNLQTLCRTCNCSKGARIAA